MHLLTVMCARYSPCRIGVVVQGRRYRSQLEGRTIRGSKLPVPSPWWQASEPEHTQAKGILRGFPHELHVRVVGLADEKVHVEVEEIHVGNGIVAVEELLNGVKTCHLEMFVPNVLARLAEIHTSPHLAGTFCWDSEESDVCDGSSSTEPFMR